MLVELRVQSAPTWIPGQGLPDDTVLELDRDGSPLPQPVDPDYHYRDDYAGKIDSIRPLTDMKAATLRNMASKDWRVVVLDLDDETLLAVRSGFFKIIRGELVPVTFEDHFGAIAAQLREQHNDPEQWERDEETRIEDQRAENKTRRIEYDRIVEEYRVLVETFPIDLHEWSLNPVGIPPAYPERPKALRLIEETPSSFEQEVLSLARALPPTMTHTGTGMYWVKKIPTLRNDTQVGAPAGQVVTLNTGGLGANAFIGGYISNTTRAEIRAIVSHNAGDATLEGNLANWQAGDVLEVYDAWSTWAAALAQLFTDQGAGVFTLLQYVKGFAGTYDEIITPNDSLNPDEPNGLVLILEGDPDDARADIVIQPTAGRAADIRMDACRLRHMTLNGNAGSATVDYSTGSVWAHVVDCVITAGGTRTALEIDADILIVEDCVISSADRTIQVGGGITVTVRRCKLTQTGGQVGEGLFSRAGTEVEGCTISGFAVGIQTISSEGKLAARNNTIHNCLVGTDMSSPNIAPLTLINNTYLSCTTNIKLSAWPDEASEGSTAGPVTLLNNLFYDYTNFAVNRNGVFRTYAQVIAMDGVTASDNQNAVDPDLDGNFAPNVGSPVINAGHGSGVVADVNGDAFDPNNPDIGAVSTGVVPAPTAPTWAANTSNITAIDAYANSEVDLTWDAASHATADIGYILQRRTTAGPGAWGEVGRTIVTSFTVSNNVNGTSYDYRVLAYARLTTEPSQTPVDTATATATYGDAPLWGGGTVSGVAAANPNTDGELNVTWNPAAQAQAFSIGYIVQYRTTIGPGAWTEAFRTNGLLGTITGLMNGTSYDVRILTYTRVGDEPTTDGTDTSTATPLSSAPALPTDPTIAVVAVDGLTVTVTITGDAAGEYRVRLMDGADTEEDEDGRVGPGDIVLTALGTGLRYLIAWGVADVYATEPTNVYLLIIPDTSDDGIAYYRVIDIIGMPGTPYRRLTLERTERPVIA